MINGIDHRDPDALSKLKEHLAALQSGLDALTAGNAYYRKHGHLDGFEQLPLETRRSALDNMNRWGYKKTPFDYTMQLLSIRKCKSDIDRMEKLQTRTTGNDKKEANNTRLNA